MKLAVKCLIFSVAMLNFLMATTAFCKENPDIMKSHPNYLVILVHGMTSDHHCFDGTLRDYLNINLGLSGYVYSYDYSDNRQSNTKNASELGDPTNSRYWIGRAKNDFIAQFPGRPIPNKIILIAHSMGGISSRVYLTSDYYRNDVKKLVTLDSPHTGGDAIAFFNKYWFEMIKEIRSDVVDLSNKNVDDYIQKDVVNNVTKWLNDQAAAEGETALGNSLNYLWNIPRWSDIEIDSAKWVVDLEMPNKDNFGVSINKALVGANFVPIYTDTLLNGAVSLAMSGTGYDELDPDSDFINKLKNKTPSANGDISYRLVSALGNPTPNKEYINNGGFLASSYVSHYVIPYTSDWNSLPNESAKYWSLLESTLFPGIWSIKNGSLLVAEDSSRGDGVKMFDQNTKRYSYYFHNDKFEDNIKGCQDLYYLLLGLALVPPYLVPMQAVHTIPMIFLSEASIWTTFDDLGSQGEKGVLMNHPHIISAVCDSQTDGPPIIDLALFDTPMATVTHLDTDVSIDAYNMTQTIVHTNTIQSATILNTSEASDNPPYAADRSVSLIFNEGTTSEVEKYTSDMLVKVPVTQISGVIHDFKPLMLSSFQISENFAAWQEFAPNAQAQKTDSQGFKYIDVDANKFHLHMDEWGRYTISGLNFAEGQNLVAFKLCNRAQYSSNQVLKVIQNSITVA